jgi:hypothetical protein
LALVDIQALGRHVGADEAIGRVVGRDGDLDRLGLHDVVERRLGLDAGRGEEGGRGGEAERERAFGKGHSKAPR